MARILPKLGLVALGALLAVLSGCSGGLLSTASDDRGSVQVSINGLPAAEAAKVQLSGPRGYSLDLPYSRTLAGLPRGTYAAAAQTVLVAGVPYAPTITGNPATIERNGQTVQIQVSYEPPTTGQLEINAAGLPSGITGPVHVTGPHGYDQTLEPSGNLLLKDLAPGDYQVNATAVVQPGTTYSPTVQGAPANVQRGHTSSVNISYTGAPNVGNLSVLLSGLPEGANPTVNISGPGGSSHTVSGSGLVADLEPGEYTLTYPSTGFDGITYAPALNTQTVTVSEGQTTLAGTEYAATTGKIIVYITPPLSVPENETVQVPHDHVRVNGPNGFLRGLNLTTTLENVEPGHYETEAPHFYKDGWTFRSTILPSHVHVPAGATIAISVVYAPKISNAEIGADLTPPLVQILEVNPWKISGTASDENGVSSVEIYDGVEYLGSAPVAPDGSWSFDLANLEPGDHEFTVFAFDAQGNQGIATRIASAELEP